MIGAGLGAVADVAMAGLSLGAATTLGATIGGAASGGWRPLWRKLENRLNGVQELTVEDPVLLLLADHLLDLARALEQRGHAAQDKLRLDDERIDEDGLRPVVSALGAARGHPDWERGEGRRGAGGSDRQALEAEIARELDRRFDSPVA